MGIKVGQLHQVFAILKCLAQLLYTRLGTVHTVDTLHEKKEKIQQRIIKCILMNGEESGESVLKGAKRQHNLICIRSKCMHHTTSVLRSYINTRS